MTLGVAQESGHVCGELRGDGVNGLVAVDAFVHEARQRPLHRGLLAKRRPIFDNDVKGCMRRHVGKRDARATVVGLDQGATLRFVDSEPFFGGWRFKRIVAFQHETPVWL